VIHEALSHAHWRNLGLESMLERYDKLRYSF
jgi:hypothetical protein